MSVIAKMYVDGCDWFANGALVGLSCVAENKLMAQYAPENEDVLFSTASPWGSARVQFQGKPNLMHQDKVYLVFVRELPDLEKAIGWTKVRVSSITDFGGTSKQVELTGSHPYQTPYGDRELQGFTMRIGIDNPGAHRQFSAGDEGWFVLIYRSQDVGMDDAIGFAHTARAKETADKLLDEAQAEE